MTHSSALPPAFLAAMHACLGERFSTVLAVREHHGRDESLYDPVLPDAVAYATSVEDISAVLALCHPGAGHCLRQRLVPGGSFVGGPGRHQPRPVVDGPGAGL